MTGDTLDLDVGEISDVAAAVAAADRDTYEEMGVENPLEPGRATP